MNLAMYQTFKSRSDWLKFKSSIKRTKRAFFKDKIQEITSKNKKP